MLYNIYVSAERQHNGYMNAGYDQVSISQKRTSNWPMNILKMYILLVKREMQINVII